MHTVAFGSGIKMANMPQISVISIGHFAKRSDHNNDVFLN
jgi:hypothetical protein